MDQYVKPIITMKMFCSISHAGTTTHVPRQIWGHTWSYNVPCQRES